MLALVTVPHADARQRDEPKPEVVDLEMRREGDGLRASYRLIGCLPQQVMERIQSGIPIRFRHKVEVVQKRPGIFVADRVFARTLVETRVAFDSLTQRYQLNRALEVKSRQRRASPAPSIDQRLTASVDEMRSWMTRFDDVPLHDPARAIPTDVELHVRVEVSLGRRWLLLIIPTTESITSELRVESAP